MYTKYFSDDGKEFDDEYECERYEREKKLNSLGQPYMWDGSGEPTQDLQWVYYLKVENTAQAEAFYLRSWYEGSSYPEDLFSYDDKTDEKIFNTGSWYYSEYDDEWHSTTKRIAELKEEISTLEKYL